MTASGAISHAWPYLHKDSLISEGESHSNLGKTDVSAWREKKCLHRELLSSKFLGAGVLKTRVVQGMSRGWLAKVRSLNSVKLVKIEVILLLLNTQNPSTANMGGSLHGVHISSRDVLITYLMSAVLD